MGMKPRKPAGSVSTRDRVRAFAFALPGAYEDHPWGESVAKVGKKVFAFFGVSENWGFTVKLPQSGEGVLHMPFAEPTGYGLGKAGWVSIKWSPDLPAELLESWVLESYRAIAPKKLCAELDARRS